MKYTWSITSSLVIALLASQAMAQVTGIRGTTKGTSTPQPVTVTPIDANHNGLDVNLVGGRVSISGADGAILDGANATIKATVKSYTNSKPLTVIQVDTNGDPLSTSGAYDGILRDGTGSTTQADVTNGRLNVDGSGVTQPVSAASLPLPSNAAQETGGNLASLVTVEGATGDAANTTGTTGTISGKLRGLVSILADVWDSVNHQLKVSIQNATLAVTQSGTWNINNISGTVSLPTGASIASKQPALGTAGTASADVITVQGITSMTPLKVDGSGVTQPVSGTVTANQGGAPWSENISQINGVTPLMGNGISGTGSPRVTIASDNTAFTVNAAQSGTWTMQPGNTANTTPWLATINQGGNSATVSAGGALKVDGSAATQPVSGTVTVQQGTGTNLHMVCDSGCSSSAGFADNSAFTYGTTAINPLGGVLDDVSTNLATENSAAVARITAQKGLHTNLRDNNGLEKGTVQNPLVVAMAPIMQAKPQVSRIVGVLGQPIGSNGDRLKVDPTPNPDACSMQRKIDAPISQTATTKIISGRPGYSIFVCAIRIVVGAAEITSEWEGTGTNCGTGTIAHSGSTTAANGESFGANGGYAIGDGTASVISLGYNTDFCIAQNGSNRVSGKVSYVYGP